MYMSKFDQVYKSLLEDVPAAVPPVASTQVPSNPHAAAPTPATGAPSQPQTTNTNGPIVDPNHNAIQALVAAKTPQDVINALKTNNVQLTNATK
jgi:hypothetical protein